MPEVTIRSSRLLLILLSFGAAGCLSDLTGVKCEPDRVCGEGYLCDRTTDTCRLACGPGVVTCGGGTYCAVQCERADGGAGVDAGFSDAGGADAGDSDAGVPDAGEVDAGRADAGVDAGALDASVPDGGFCGDAGAFSTGLLLPGQISTLSSTAAWQSVGLVSADDTLVATTELLLYQQVTDALVVKNLGFALSPNDEIKGITVRVRRAAPGFDGGLVFDHEVRLLRPGGPGPVKGPGAAWSTPMTDVYFGAPGDTWGADWTPADVNDPQFGFSLSARAQAGGMIAQIDSVTVTVTVDTPASVVGPLAPGDVINQSTSGGLGAVAWANPQDAVTPDTLSASVPLTAPLRSQRLAARKFGVVSPTSAALSGIAVEILRRCDVCNGTARDEELALVSGSDPIAFGANKATVVSWPMTDGWVRHGGLRDLWATTTLDGTAVQDAEFGVGLAVRLPSGFQGTPSVNAIRMTLYYGVSTQGLARVGIASSVPGGKPWVALSNALTDNNLFASAPNLIGTEQSEMLVAKDFGFLIPNNATVNGVEFEVKRQLSDPGDQASDRAGRLVVDSLLRGAIRTSTPVWDTTSRTATFGAPADLFGITRGVLTPALVNSPSFGSALSVGHNGPGSATPLVDVVRMQVHYSCP